MEKFEVKCKCCKRRPDEIDEYTEMVEDGEYKTPEQAVRMNEGTFNPFTGEFYCTSCYIKNGMPLGMA